MPITLEILQTEEEEFLSAGTCLGGICLGFQTQQPQLTKEEDVKSTSQIRTEPGRSYCWERKPLLPWRTQLMSGSSFLGTLAIEISWKFVVPPEPFLLLVSSFPGPSLTLFKQLSRSQVRSGDCAHYHQPLTEALLYAQILLRNVNKPVWNSRRAPSAGEMGGMTAVAQPEVTDWSENTVVATELVHWIRECQCSSWELVCKSHDSGLWMSWNTTDRLQAVPQTLKQK